MVARLDFGDGPVEEGFQSVTSRTRYRLSEGGYGWHHLYLSDRPPQLTERKVKKESYRDFIYGPKPTQYTYSAFGIDLPDGYYELLFSMIDLSKTPQDHGPMWIVAQGRDSTEHFTVPVDTLVERKLETRVVDGRLNLVFNSDTDSDWMINGLVITRVGPFIGHVPVRRTSGQDDLNIQITTSGPDPIQSAHLTYGSDRTGYRRTSMGGTGQWTYEARVPRSELVDGLTYFIHAEDLKGRRVQFPPSGADDPIRLSVTDDEAAPSVVHEKIKQWTPGRSLAVAARVSDPSGVKSVHLRYRGISQHQDFASIKMLPTGRKDEYRAEIPGGEIDSRWDLMYYIEVLDRHGNGAIYPDLNVETPYVIVNLHAPASLSELVPPRASRSQAASQQTPQEKGTR